MRLLAGLFAGAFTYLAIGALLGQLPQHPLAVRRTVRVGRRERLDVWLRQTGAHLTAGQFLAVSTGAGLLAGVVTYAIAGAVPVAIVPALVVGLAPRWWFTRQHAITQRTRLQGWPDALRDLVAHLDAAMSLHRALGELAVSGPAPLRPTFQRYNALATVTDPRPALEAVREELADPVSDRIIAVLIAGLEQGTRPIRDVLVALADAATEDVRLHDDIRTRQVEHHIEAVASVVLPFAVLVILCAGSPPFRDFYRTPAGVAVIAIGSAMSFAGLAVIRRLGRLPAEPRVIGGAR